MDKKTHDALELVPDFGAKKTSSRNAKVEKDEDEGLAFVIEDLEVNLDHGYS